MQNVIDPAKDTPEQQLDIDLLDKAKRLKNSSFFMNPSEGVELLDKQQILLVLAGYKPVSIVASGHWVKVPGGRRMTADDPAQVGAFLQSLGLAYHLSSFDDHATDAVVALKSELVEEYLNALGTSAHGRLFGYPETAVRAFAAGEQALLSLDEQERREQEAGLSKGVTTFRLSREHWAEELEIVRKWLRALRAADLAES